MKFALAQSPIGPAPAYDWLPGDDVPDIGTGDTYTWTTLGVVYAFTPWDPDGPGPAPPVLVVGGSFARAGAVQANNVALWDGRFWHAMGGGFNRTVYALAVYHGEVIAGGEFTYGDGKYYEGLARWDGSHWQPMPTIVGHFTTIYALRVMNGELFAAGFFIRDQAPAFHSISRWDGATWRSVGAGFTGSGDTVRTLAEFNGELIAGGRITRSGSTTLNNIARWDGVAWQSMPGLTSNQVFSTADLGYGLAVAGDFQLQDGPLTSVRVALWNGASWKGLGPGLPQPYGTTASSIALAVHQGRLFAGGNLIARQGGEKAICFLAEWTNPDWIPALDYPNLRPYSMCTFQGEFVIGSYPAYSGLLKRPACARWNGEEWRGLGEGFRDSMVALAEYDGRLIVGGDSPLKGLLPIWGMATFDGARWQPFTPPLANPTYPYPSVWAMLPVKDSLVVGGEFKPAAAPESTNIAMWTGSDWKGLGRGSRRLVWSLADYRHDLIATGEFQEADDTPIHQIARWDGQSWHSLKFSNDPTELPAIWAVAVFRDELIVGGTFSTAGGQPANMIARWNGERWAPLGGGLSGSSQYPAVLALRVWNDTLYVGGEFDQAGNTPVANIAAWDGTHWSPVGGGLDGRVRGLTEFDRQLIACGTFTRSKDTPLSYIGAWNGRTWRPLGIGLNGDAWTALQVGEELLVLGSFTVAGHYRSFQLARWAPSAYETSVPSAQPDLAVHADALGPAAPSMGDAPEDAFTAPDADGAPAIHDDSPLAPSETRGP
ncbi:MAG: hypothetical protein U1A27_05920 [Phycisphaerae bacterium]